jgi:hypothetical protein
VATSVFNNLFFVSRRPSLHKPKNWLKPALPKDYDCFIQKEGFVTLDDLTEYIKKQSNGSLDQFPTIQQDIKDLNGENFVDHFCRYDQEAKHYQNAYYLYHWVFVLGALTTTALSILSVTSASMSPVLRFGLWGLTVVVALATAVYSVMNRTDRPQREWYLNRRRAEVLRSHYYLYLARVPPYHGNDSHREQKMQEILTMVDQLGTEQGSQQEQPYTDDKEIRVLKSNYHTPQEIEFLKKIYAEKRIEAQENYYEKSREEYDANAKFAIRSAALLMALSPVLATVGVSIEDTTIAAVAAFFAIILPSVAAALISFQQIYGWDRQRSLYRATLLQLRKARQPLDRKYDMRDPALVLAKTILACEKVLTAESDQWGQDILSHDEPKMETITVDTFQDLVASTNLPEEQKESIQKILDAGKNTTLTNG